MLFSHDTERSLAETAALVNTVGLDGDTLVTLADLDDFLARYPYSVLFAGLKPSLSRYALCGLGYAGFGQPRTGTRQRLSPTRSLPKPTPDPTWPGTTGGTGTCTSRARTLRWHTGSRPRPRWPFLI